MGVISDWQDEYDTSDFLSDQIEAMKRQYANGTDSADRYHINMALMYVMRKDCATVRYHCSQISPEADKQIQSDVLISLGRLLIIENKIDEALELYEQAWQKEESMDIAASEAGEIYLELEKYAEALLWFQRSLQNDPECDFVHAYAGKAAAGLEDYPLALEYFTKAIQYDEAKTYTAENEYFVGLCYDKMGDFYRALHHYTLCLEADPLFGEALGNMAALYYNQDGDIHNALTYLKKAEAIAEETKNAYLLQLIYMNLSRLYDKIKDFEKHEYYKQKMMGSLGFGFMFEDCGDEDDDEEEDFEEEG